MSRVLVVAPHPDDETLGCGGTIMRHRADGDDVSWLIVTAMKSDLGFTADRMAAREQEIATVAEAYGFAATHRLDFPTCRLDTFSASELIPHVAESLNTISPNIVYLPFRGDAHNDHRVVFDTFSAALKWFRTPGIQRILAYETLSETGFSLAAEGAGFQPNVFVDIADYLEGKIAMMAHYQGEMGAFPFPRSDRAIRALAALRGSQCGVEAAEAFMLLKEVR